MITYQKEKFSDCIEEAKPLLLEHWEDVGFDKDNAPLNPNYEQYQNLCNANVLHIITVREDDKLIGYSSWFVSYNLHYQDKKFAECDIFFLSEPFRKGLVGYNLLKQSTQILRNLGVDYITAKDKKRRDIGVLFRRLGYEAIETVYLKKMDDK